MASFGSCLCLYMCVFVDGMAWMNNTPINSCQGKKPKRGEFCEVCDGGESPHRILLCDKCERGK